MPLDVSRVLPRLGLSGPEYRVLIAIMQRFYAPENLDATHKPKRAVGVSRLDFRAATGLGNSSIHEALQTLKGLRVIEIHARGGREAFYAIREAEVWVSKPRQAPRGARTQRRRQVRLKLHRGGGAL